MHPWVRDYLAKQVLIPGDFISIYQFYGETDHCFLSQYNPTPTARPLLIP